jgi:ubiquinone/menaquinone biosynthesis C-methylase UbiE
VSTAIEPPFDGVAAEYDARFTDRLLARWLRAAVQERLARAFRPGDHVLELGCGTGEDAVWLARRGMRVTATDQSPAMLDVARRKTKAAGVQGRIELKDFDLGVPADGPWAVASFDGAFSNFGAVNCLADRTPLAAALAEWVRPGGRVILVVMGPFCPWEAAWYLSRGRPHTALRRFRSGREAGIGSGASVRVWYPSPRRLTAEFHPAFRHLGTVGIGVLLPPSFAADLVDRRPRLFGALRAMEHHVATRFPGTWLNDHYLVEFERR